MPVTGPARHWVVETFAQPTPGSFYSSIALSDGSRLCVVASTLEEHDRIIRELNDAVRYLQDRDD